MELGEPDEADEVFEIEFKHKLLSAIYVYEANNNLFIDKKLLCISHLGK